ncbi:kinase-like domain-containing protein [Kalaharituber pfeilii]|nr:kinase-like domain-containing protein [Kalaharituber pfeilii]
MAGPRERASSSNSLQAPTAKNNHGRARSVTDFIDIHTYPYRKIAIDGCKSQLLVKELTSSGLTGLTSKSRSTLSSPKDMVAVDIFLASEVDEIVKNRELVKIILNCDCKCCAAVCGPSFEGWSRKVEEEILDNIPQSRRNMPLLFAILCYLGVPFMVHFDIWKKPVEDHEGNVTFDLDEVTLMCFGKVHDQLINKNVIKFERDRSTSASQLFYTAFKQAERQFHPVLIAPHMPKQLPADVVFPIKIVKGTRMRGGAYGKIIQLQIPTAFRENLGNENASSAQYFACKTISLISDCTKKSAEREREGLEYMARLQHKNLLQMYLWYDYCNLRHFLLPWYEGDLDKVLKGILPSENFHPKTCSPYTVAYRFPTEHWLWKGVLGLLDGLARFHNSGLAASHAGREGVWRGAHFDLKPSNILIDGSGELVIADCGISRVKKIQNPAADGLTTKSKELTPAYAPPETEIDPTDSRIRVPKMNQSFDVWAMACIMFEVMIFLIGGQEAFGEFTKRKQQPEDNAFWTIEKDRPKLKDAVTYWLLKAQAYSQVTEDKYLYKLVLRLKTMFNIDYNCRGTIDECLRNLQDMEPSFYTAETERERILSIFLDDDNSRLDRVVESLPINTDIAKTSMELGYKHLPHWLRSMCKIPLKCLRDGNTDPFNCRIKLFEDEATDKVSLTITYIIEYQIFCEVDSAHKQTEGLIVLNLFDDSASKVTWRFRGLQKWHRFTEEDPGDFYKIREALNGQTLVPDTRLVLEKCSLIPWSWTRKIHSPRPIVSEVAAIEVWTESTSRLWLQKQTQNNELTGTESRASTGGRQSGTKQETAHKPRLVIFQRHLDKTLEGILILLRGKCIVMAEKSLNPENKTVEILSNHFNGARHTFITYHKVPMGTEGQPLGIPLKHGEIAKIEEGDALYARRLELHFRDRIDLLKFKAAFKKQKFLEPYWKERKELVP